MFNIHKTVWQSGDAYHQTHVVSAVGDVASDAGGVGTVVIGGTVGGIGIGVAAIRIGDFGPTGRPCTWCGPYQAV